MKRPNIVFIMADDLGYGDVGCYGNKVIETPHIDSLAERGMKFTDYHSSGPVCTPTRAALMTGRYQQRSGLEGVIYVSGETRQTGLDPGQYSVAEALKEQGYATAIYGKWHLGYKRKFNPVHFGFDEFRGYVSGNVDYHSHVDNAGIPDWWKNLEKIEEEGYVTDLVSEHGARFIREHQDEPFFCYVSHEAPHWPYQGREDEPDRFPGSTDFPSWGSRTDRKAAYREMVEAMDDGVGLIVDTLRELDLEEDTLIVFCSDNGAVEELGDNGGLRGAKGDVYEGGHRVPCIATWPGRIPAGTITDETVLSMDWFPTFNELAGDPARISRPLDGDDVGSVMLDGGRMPERTLFWRYGSQKASRSGNWKLMVDEGEEMLFDLEEDIGETTDMLDEKTDIAGKLRADLADWESELPAMEDMRTE
ncbi:MAG: sulfatase-like hydrolase/transferase [Planctomycetota bacterium]